MSKEKYSRQVFMNSDGRGLGLLLVAVYSLLKHNDPDKPITIFIAHDKTFLEVGGKESIDSIVARFPYGKVRYIDFSPHVGCPGSVFDSMLWGFTFIGKIMPPDAVGQVLYLDTDMVIRKDLGELFAIDLKKEGKIAAAMDESPRAHRPYLVAAGWPEEAGNSFNNATSLIDLDAFRAEKISDRLIEWYVANEKIAINSDQDAQNVIYGSRTMRLPLKWNYNDGWLERLPKMNPFAKMWRVYPAKDVIEAVLDPCIIHYIGHRKPTIWTHRPERKIFHQMMREIGILQGGPPGETGLRIVVARMFDVYHWCLRRYARFLRRVVR